MDAASSWERLAKSQPYWGVLSHDEYKGASLDEAVAESFWHSGEVHVEAVMDQLREAFGAGLPPSSVLDFGSGVGRLLLPFARRAATVIGVDASPTMRSLARRHLDDAGLRNVTLAESLTAVAGPVDLVHSTLVFQHIPPKHGYRLVAQLARLVADGGCGYLHFRIRNADGALRRLSRNALASSRTLRVAAAAARRHDRDEARMSMFEYDAGAILELLNRDGIERCSVRTVRQAAGALDAVVLLKRGW